jgi:hypothetical protein
MRGPYGEAAGGRHGVMNVCRRPPAALRSSGVAAVVMIAVAACGGGRSTGSIGPNGSGVPSRPTTSTLPPLPAVNAGNGQSGFACSLITASQVAALTGSPADQPVLNGETPAYGSSPGRSQCVVNSVAAGEYSIRIDVERYSSLGAAIARFHQVDQPAFEQLPGLDDGGYVQAPASAGVRHGTDLAYVEGVPPSESASATLRGLITAVAANFNHPVQSLGPPVAPATDPDPCRMGAVLQQIAKQTPTSITRVQPAPPFAWSCVFAFPQFTITASSATGTTLATTGTPVSKVFADITSGFTASGDTSPPVTKIGASGTGENSSIDLSVTTSPLGVGIENANPASSPSDDWEIEIMLNEDSRCEAILQQYKRLGDLKRQVLNAEFDRRSNRDFDFYDPINEAIDNLRGPLAIALVHDCWEFLNPEE